MADASYRIAPIFLIRMAGVPFEALEKLATIETSRAGRELIAAGADFFAGAMVNFSDIQGS